MQKGGSSEQSLDYSNSFPEEWYLHDSQGFRATPSASYGNMIMDVRNYDYQADYLTRWESILSDPNINGLYLDYINECPPLLTDSNCDSAQIEAILGYSTADWKDNLQNLLARLKKQFRTKNIIFNSAYTDEVVNPSQQDFLGVLDGAYIGGFEKILNDEQTHSRLFTVLNNLAYSPATKSKQFILQANANILTEARRQYLYANYLLFARDGVSYYQTNIENNQLNNYPEWELPLDVTSIAPVQRPDGIIERSFGNAVVYVNPTGTNKSFVFDNSLFKNKKALVWNNEPVQYLSDLTLNSQEAMLVVVDETDEVTLAPTQPQEPTDSGTTDWSDNSFYLYSDFENVNSEQGKKPLKVGNNISLEITPRTNDSYDDGLLINGQVAGTFPLTVGNTYQFTIKVSNYGRKGYTIYVWVDWDGKGQNPPVKEFYNYNVNTDTVMVNIPVPTYAGTNAFVRIFSVNEPVVALEHNMNYPQGEVEDFILQIVR